MLHNRGGLFTLLPHRPNTIAPKKQPLNTLSAGFVMQAQGHAQTMVNIFDLGANLQAATDMARFRHRQVPNRLELESSLFNLVGSDLGAMGHSVVSADGASMGGFQSILFIPSSASPAGARMPRVRGFYRAGSDHRKDGQAVGW
ncbi:gamma-glutamyltransferase family protein [Pendulispora rubella]|uniref:Gamma-glutamyltransferase family protein n=1 Tax=Pendulispora rubella TaxID=2741070 RepID=A0ABZ2LBU0_9BACT